MFLENKCIEVATEISKPGKTNYCICMRGMCENKHDHKCFKSLGAQSD